MGIEHQRGPIGHKRYGVANWPQLGSRLELPQHPWRRVNLCCCDIPRAPLDGTPAVSQLRAKLDRGPILEGAAPSRKKGRVPRRSSSSTGVFGRFPGTSRTIFKGPGEDGEEEEKNSVEEEESDGTEGVPAPVEASQHTGGPTLSQSNQPVSHQSEPSVLAIMQQMTQIMANLQAASPSGSSTPPAFKTPSMKAPECFDGTQPFKVRSCLQSCQLIFDK
ncbi:hypothetical protein O181_112549 [Austropuccinia psidii MF-1]|uniref:Uncharacterized protein n=1 Tax=Austropuccinia psidii MF-1 TaxID=1389203 RepID=A0A9Q3K206_9BASI|nr:hypothetical protein [Austropuccinia psidii MF-1]